MLIVLYIVGPSLVVSGTIGILLLIASLTDRRRARRNEDRAEALASCQRLGVRR